MLPHVSACVCCLICLLVYVQVDVWQSLLAVHTLVIPPEGNADSWLKLAAHCRRTGKHSMCYKAITKLLQGRPEDTGLLPLSPAVDPKITLAWIKYLWATDQRKQACIMTCRPCTS